MHSIAESYPEARVPGGAPYMSVEARLSTVRIVYMQRFLDEFTEYLAGVFECLSCLCWRGNCGGE